MKTLIYGKENLVKDLVSNNTPISMIMLQCMSLIYKFEAGPKIHIFRRVVQSSQVETFTEMAQSV